MDIIKKSVIRENYTTDPYNCISGEKVVDLLKGKTKEFNPETDDNDVCWPTRMLEYIKTSSSPED